MRSDMNNPPTPGEATMNIATNEIIIDQTYLAVSSKPYLPEQLASFARMIFRHNRDVSIVTFRDVDGHTTQAFRNDFGHVTMAGVLY
jgi:hypothetical protein